MSAQYYPIANKSSKAKVGCVIGAGLVLVLAGLSLVAYLISLHGAPPAPMMISIISPQNGDIVRQDTPVELQVMAAFSPGIARLELYADGALVSAKNSPLKNGAKSLLLQDFWNPPTMGRHVLMARGYGSDQSFSDSIVVFVDVIQPPATQDVQIGQGGASVQEIASRTGVTAEEIRAANPSLASQDLNAPLPAGTLLRIPNLPPPATMGAGATGSTNQPTPGVPAATSVPENPDMAGIPTPPPSIPAASDPPTNLRVTSDCSMPVLNWNDSRYEEYYNIYRIGPGTVRQRVAYHLPANTTTFTDSIPEPGEYRYQVTSVLGARETLGPMVVMITDEVCAGREPIAIPGEVDLTLTIATMETTRTWDGIYCYFQVVDLTSIERFPGRDPDVLSPVSFNPRLYSFTSLPNRGSFHLSAIPLDVPVVLRGDCYGRRLDEIGRPVSEPIGNVNVTHPSGDWDGSLRVARTDGFQLRYCLGPSGASTACSGPVAGMPTDTPPEDMPPGSGPGEQFVSVPSISQMFSLPAPTNLRIQNGLDICWTLDDQRAAAACFLYGAFTGGYPTLYWDWSGNAYNTEAMLSSYRVQDSSSAFNYRQTASWDITNRTRCAPSVVTPLNGDYSTSTCGALPRFMALPIGSGHCDFHHELSVTAIRGDRQSAPSNIITINDPACPEVANVEVTFQNINLPPGDEGDISMGSQPADATLEIFARLTVDSLINNTFSSKLILPYSPVPRGTHTVFTELAPGQHNFADLLLTNPISSFPTWAHDLNGRTGNNRQSVTITTRELANPDDAGGFRVYIQVYEYDYSTRRFDLLCEPGAFFGYRTAREWLALDSDFTLNDNLRGGICEATVHLRATPPGR